MNGGKDCYDTKGLGEQKSCGVETCPGIVIVFDERFIESKFNPIPTVGVYCCLGINLLTLTCS